MAETLFPEGISRYTSALGVLSAAAHDPLPDPAEEPRRSTRPLTDRRLWSVAPFWLVETGLIVTVLLSVLVGTNIDQMPFGVAEFLSARVSIKNVLLLGMLGISWFGLFSWLGLHEGGLRRRFRDQAMRLVVACSIGTAFGMILPLTSVSGSIRGSDLVIFWLGSMAGTISLRAVRHLALRRRRERQTVRVIIVGTGPRALEFCETLRHHTDTRYEVFGFVDTSQRLALCQSGMRPLGTLDQLETILMRQVVDEVFILLPVRSQYGQIQKALRICEDAGVRAKYPTDIFNAYLARPRIDAVHGSGVVVMHVVADDYRVLFKRIVDVIGASLAMLLFAPVMGIAALAVKLTGPGPVIFSQERYGLNKRRFRMFKFRTMTPDAEQLQATLEHRNEANGPLFKIARDPRITRVGRILRATSIDELPQLWNVLCGDMSLVGPRPMSIRDVDRFTKPTDMRRFSVRPGVTGLWQVSGRSTLRFEKWIELDLKYIDEWSLRLDLVILLRTIPAVVGQVGAV